MPEGESARQPRGLFLLFFTELWERFGFYTMQTIIVLYMTKSLLYGDDKTYLLYGAFSSLLYLTPVIGGYLADRFIGFRQAILIGGLLFVVGYLLTALHQEKAFFIGLSAIIVANGFFKPSVSSIVGELYQPNDPRRDGGFTIFYMGINVGSLIPPLITGVLVTKYGWHAGFLLAAVGMAIGMATFIGGKKRLGVAGDVPSISPLHENPSKKKIFNLFLGIGTLIAVFLVHLIFYIPREADIILIIASILIIFAVIYFLLKERPEQRRKMQACLILILISVLFWALYSQTFTSLMLFADRNMGKQFLGVTIDAEFTQFFNPFFIVILSPILSWLWVWLDRRNLNPSTPMKFSFAVLFMAFAFLFLGGAVAFFSKGGMSSPWWLAGNYFLQTIGELLLSPIGLAMVTRLAPKHLVGMMMGVWFLTQSAAFAIGSLLSTLADVPKEVPPELSIGIYSHAFYVFGILSMALAAVSFLLVPFLKRLIHSPNAG
jgi:proton-dependent oligopeptide transporter, POT family